MMNQAASATRRPAGSTATTGCCPMFNAPFFVNSFAPQTSLVPPPAPTRQCFLGPQTNQIQQTPTTQPPPQQHNVAPPQSVNHHNNHQPQPPHPAVPSNGSNSFQPQQPLQQQQQQATRPQDLTTNYNNSTSSQAVPGLSLQHLRHSAIGTALNSLLPIDQFQAMLLNQLFANQQFAPSVTVPAQPQQQTSVRPLHQQQQQQQQQPQQQHQSGPGQVTLTPAQHITTPVVPQQQQVHEPAPGQQQTFQPQQATAQPRLAQVPIVDSYTSSGINQGNNNTYQQQQHNTSSVNHNLTASDSVPQIQHQPQQPSQQQQQVPPLPQQQQPLPQQQQQQQQQQQTIPPMFYSIQQMEQALALLANPQVTNTIFSQVFNIYFQSGIRPESHPSHHQLHHAAHHFHHHLHGAHHHHHHHHGPNGQGNGQDVTMPLDSLAISESKPRGLNRAEIDSLTPYIHLNEKDSRTCVICLSKFELKSKIRPLPCNHAFHAKCVDKWLRANRTCPICRRDALKTYNAKIKRI